MKADCHFCSLACVTILLSLSFTAESIAQERPVAPPRPATSTAVLSACSPDGEFFVMVTGEGRITYGRTSDGANLHTFYQCNPQAVEFSPDGRLLASTGGSNGSPARVKVWNVEDGQLLGRWETKGRTDVQLYEKSMGHKPSLLPTGQALAFSPDGQWLLASKPDGATVVWKFPGLHCELVVSAPVAKSIVIKGRSAGLAFSRDGTRLTSGESVWSALDGTLLTGTGLAARKGRPAFSSDGKHVANGLDILEACNGNQVTSIDPGFGKRKHYGVAFSPDGKRIAVGNGERGAGDLKIFAIPGGEELQTFIGHTNPVWDVAFSLDGRFLASASGRWQVYNSNGGPGEARLWDAHTGESVQIHETPLCLYSIAFSGDSRRFAASGGVYKAGLNTPPRGEIKVWDAASGEELFSAVGLPSCVYSLALSPDGKRLVAAVGPEGESGAFDVKLWDVETGREIQTLGRHEKEVYGVAFSADGKRIASGGEDGVIQIWSLE